MDISRFDAYQEALTRRKRDVAKAYLLEFVESFVSIDEQANWTRHYLETQLNGRKIRYETYEHVIFPVLLVGYRKADPWSIKWLAATAENLYENQNLWKEIDMKTDYRLRRDLVDLCPNDASVKSDLLSRMIDFFQYSAHEWPAGILFGKDGASVKECDQIIAEILEARSLDEALRFSEFLIDYEAKVLEYRQSLIAREE